jgi:hypothetical protein
MNESKTNSADSRELTTEDLGKVLGGLLPLPPTPVGGPLPTEGPFGHYDGLHGGHGSHP